MQPILGRTWLEWIRLSRIFRAPFANLSLEIVKKMSRYYLLSGLSRIFRKPFANVYISRKVPFAQTFQIYACGPRSYKTFHGFLHDSQIYTYEFMQTTICLETLDSMAPNRSRNAGILGFFQLQIWVPAPMEVPNFDPKAWRWTSLGEKWSSTRFFGLFRIMLPYHFC